MSNPTIVVKFGDSVTGEDSLFIVELDDFLNIDSDGEVKTQFFSGDQIHFLMHYDSSKLVVKNIKTTDGQVVLGQKVNREKTVELLFDDPSTPQELMHVPDSISVEQWYGRTSILRREGRSIYAESTPCIGDIVYEYSAIAAKLVTPNVEIEAGDEYPIAVVIYVEAAI